MPHIISKVLSALGSHSQDSGATELPSDVLQAWGARKEKLAAEAEDDQNRQQKLTVGQRAATRPTYGMCVECDDVVLHTDCFQMNPVDVRRAWKILWPRIGREASRLLRHTDNDGVWFGERS